MLDNKKIEEAKISAIKSINAERIIKTKDYRYVEFFINNAKNSLDSAKLLFDASTNEKTKNFLGMPNFNGFLWVINSSYYSMFYMVRALLESMGIKIIGDESVHSLTYNALIYYFYSTGKLEKHFIEEFDNAKEESNQILGKEKAREMINEYYDEKDKRGRITYETGEIAMKGKAETSLKRAKTFNEEIRKIIGK